MTVKIQTMHIDLLHPKKKSKTPIDSIQSPSGNKVNNPYVKRQRDKEQSDEHYFFASNKSKTFVYNPKNKITNLDHSSSSEEEIIKINKNVHSRLIKKHKKEVDELTHEIKELKYENKLKSAIIRQYRNKNQKIKRLLKAALDREDCLIEEGNFVMENQNCNQTEIDSDPEDKEPQNIVSYS